MGKPGKAEPQTAAIVKGNKRITKKSTGAGGGRAGKKERQKRVEIRVLFFCKVSPTIWKR